MRAFLAALFLGGVAHAQTPDVRFHLDLYGTYEGQNNNSGSLRLYSPLGETSTIQIAVLVEPGLRAFFSQRLTQFPRDPSPDSLEQYYFEDEGIWRVGKQYLPFGSGNLVRENVLAARGQTNLLFENMSLVAAVCDGGSGNQRGVTARFGGRFGISAAIGRDFGISATSFDVIRSPEDSPGSGRGWKEMFDVDDSKRIGKFTTSAEVVWLRGGETNLDENETVADLSEEFAPDRSHRFLVGYSYQSNQTENVIRFASTVPMTKTTSLEPLLRYRNGKFWDTGITFHVRL